jgi:UDP-N-acetylmuramyl pentapeptide synthase
MPIFMIERNFADQLSVSPEAAASIKQINGEVGVQWLISFLSADKKKTYCLYEASSPADIREAATRLGIPADVIIEVGELHTTGQTSEVVQSRFA